ncbi:hypothetical protein [Amycolatopsis antarctica]|uniref:hypothetical protein n=1 Tax=Amycolatopsis antarctica TaxID=1854586 RepID=UPI0010542FB3|nr:hypothetical protein [Amycolatopsis antarctica]
MSIIAHRPPVPAGVGRNVLAQDRHARAEIDLAHCTSCRATLVHQIRTDPAYRRLGYARALLTVARIRGRDHTWSTMATAHTTQP